MLPLLDRQNIHAQNNNNNKEMHLFTKKASENMQMITKACIISVLT